MPANHSHKNYFCDLMLAVGLDLRLGVRWIELNQILFHNYAFMGFAF